MKHSTRLEFFERTWARYGKFLKFAIWKLTGDREFFADAMQNALLGMWQNIEKLTGEKAGGYIYRIAQSAASKAWRKRAESNGQISAEQISAGDDPAQSADDAELKQLVRRRIAELPAKQAAAIMMRYFQQKDYQSVAVRLNCSEAAARSNVSKALATLKRKLANER